MMTPMTKPMSPGPQLDAEVERVCYNRQVTYHQEDGETPTGWYVTMTDEEVAALPVQPPDPSIPSWRNPYPFSTEIHFAWLLIERYRLHVGPWDEKIWIIANMHDRNHERFDYESAATAAWGVCLIAMRIASGYQRGLLPGQPPTPIVEVSDDNDDAARRIINQALPPTDLADAE